MKILDFGIARAAEFAEEEAKKGLIKGKVSYLSPEQIYVRPFDARADIFALGVVFHEMLTGRRLFQSKNDITKMRELLAAPILPPSAIDAMIPRELDRIVMKSLAIDPKDRFQTLGRHGGRPRAHADRGALLQPRAVEDASRAVPGGGRPLDRHRRVRREGDALEHTIAITSTGTPPPAEHTRTTGRHGGQPGQLGHPGRKRRRRGWTACCAPSARAWNACAGSRRLKFTVIALVGAVALGAIAYAAKKYLPESAAAATAGATPVMKNQEAPATATPAAKPAAVPGKATRKRVPSTHKTKGHAPAAGTPEETTEKAVEDAPHAAVA